MTRNITPAFAAAVEAGEKRPFILFEGTFKTGVVRLWTGTTTLQYGALEWTGGGALMGVSGLQETSEVVAQGVTVALSGVPLDLVQIALDEAEQGALGRLWLGFLDEAGSVIPEPVQIFAGRLDVPTITDDAQTCIIAITYESIMADLLRPREWRYTDESHRALYPDDFGFVYVTSMQGRNLVWGRG